MALCMRRFILLHLQAIDLIQLVEDFYIHLRLNFKAQVYMVEERLAGHILPPQWWFLMDLLKL